MATIALSLWPEEALSLTTAFTTFSRITGSTTNPYSGIWFGPTNDSQAFWRFLADGYGSGSVTVEIYWYATNATSGDVIFDASIDAMTPDVDTTSMAGATFGAIASVTDTHLGTTSQRLHKCTIVVTDTDGLAAGDLVCLRLNRDANAAGDTMLNEAAVTCVRVSYSDT